MSPAAWSGAVPGWGLDPAVAVPLGVAGAVYARGWLRLARRCPARAPGPARLAAFAGGLGAVALALGSPLHELGEVLLQAHMVQHVLLTMVAPPLIWLSAPLVPFLHGVPRAVATGVAGPLLRWPPVRGAARLAGRPVVAWVIFAAAIGIWHLPAAYQLALASEPWHHVQHACFLGAALVFWWAVLRPWPARPAPAWPLVAALVLADLQNMVLGAWLAFSDRVVYPAYAEVAHPWPVTALADQAAAAVIMWVPGSIAFLVPAAWLVVRTLGPAPAPPGPPLALDQTPVNEAETPPRFGRFGGLRQPGARREI